MTATAQPPQHMLALARANAIRIERAHIRQQVHGAGTYTASCRELAAIFAAGPPECMATMRVEQALRWVFRMGPVRLDECLAAAGCSRTKKVGALTGRQLDRLAETLADWGCGRNAS